MRVQNLCNGKDLRENLQFFKVPEAGIEVIRSKLAMKIYDEYAKVLEGTDEGMYSARFNGSAGAVPTFHS